MYNYHNKKKLVWSIILILLLAIGIGYAYLTSNLSISGNTQVSTNTWNIHFENLNVSTGSVTASTAASINAAGDAVTYTINLNRPKEYYEFTVDVKNDGTLPGKVSISQLTGITTDAEPIIDYSIAYTNGNPVQVGDILNSGAKKTIRVRVFYKDEIEPDDFPANNLNLTLTYTLQFLQSEKDEVTVNNIIQNLKANNSTCFVKYEGNVTDRIGTTEEATNVYFDTCIDNRNIIFGGYCWQAIRTTETGGLKLIYNGEPVDNKCESTRSNHKGINGYLGENRVLNTSYKYGKSFTYDETSNTFTLIDTFDETWDGSNYNSLNGTYTCMTSSDICNTLYNVSGYISNTNAMLPSYKIENIHYSVIGSSIYNAKGTISDVGYMSNKEYRYRSKAIDSNTYKFGHSFNYDDNTHSYELSETTKNISGNYSNLSNTRYTCWNTSGICDTISYVHHNIPSSIFYVDMSNGKSISDIINDMLFDDEVNKYDSTIKGIIDNWYKQNLISKTNMLEKTIYCNARNITDYGNFNPDGGSSIYANSLYFKNNSLNTDLTCSNLTDQFSVDNNKAKLKYPIALSSEEELYYISNSTNGTNLLKTGYKYWSISPYKAGQSSSYLRYVDNGAYLGDDGYSNEVIGIRPSISILTSAVVLNGTGSETSPWVIE